MVLNDKKTDKRYFLIVADEYIMCNLILIALICI